jgi:cell division protein FtsI (penicillin-binding protein 3)
MTKKTKKWLRFRILSLFAFFVFLFVVLIARSFQLQILSQKTLKPMAAKQHTKALQLQPDRGLIMDRNGEKLAISIQMDSVCAEPAKISNANATASSLASILGSDKSDLYKKISTSKHFCWVARMISPSQASAIQALDIEGVYLVKEPRRFYPNQKLAGPVLGFVGLDASGLEGIELKYEDLLKRDPEKMLWGRDAKGNKLFLKDNLKKEKNDRDYNILLTIDSRIQYLVETQLKEAVESKMAKGAMAIVMDPRTGEVLAMAQEPGFNPNVFSRSNLELKKNRVINDSFDPGSTFKPFVVAAALEEGVLKEKEQIFCENGAYKIANRVIHEAQRKRHGYLTYREVLKYSSNIGSAKIGQKLGKDAFYEYIKSFGFGSKTGIDLPGEASGILRSASKWTTVDAATIAFGQGISVTAMQLVTAFSAIANKGVLMKPYLVKAVVDQKGQLIREYKPTIVRQVISAPTAFKMSSVLTDVVSASDGTGKNARIQNVSVAGKTGTSQKFDFASNRYSSERVRTSFVGFFPADDPQVVIYVMIDEPQRDKWGGVAAAPVFRNIGEQILRCYDGNAVDAIEKSDEEIKKDTGIQLITSRENIPDESMRDEKTMPDFRGMSIKKVLKLARERGVGLNAVGSGWAVRQDPSPGVPITEKATCTVVFSAGVQ